MTKIGLDRRRFLIAGGATAVLGAVSSWGAGRAVAAGASNTSSVRFTGDGLSLSATEYAEVLSSVAGDADFEPDLYGDGGVLAKLETRFADLLGKETAVFLPTGTLANHIALRRHARKGRRIVLQAKSHVYNDSGDCAQNLSGLNLVPVEGDFTAAAIERVLDASRRGRVNTPVGAISLESPLRRGFNTGHELAEVREIRDLARSRDVGLHLDGARLFMQAAHHGFPPHDFAAAFDTVYVSLYKNFNAAGGAILAGPADLLAGLSDERRMFGGSPCRSWPLAAVALKYAEGFIDAYRRAKAVFDRMTDLLAGEDRLDFEAIPNGCNTAWLHVDGVDPAQFVRRLAARDIHLMPPREHWPGLMLILNPTVARMSAEDLAAGFRGALRG